MSFISWQMDVTMDNRRWYRFTVVVNERDKGSANAARMDLLSKLTYNKFHMTVHAFLVCAF